MDITSLQQVFVEIGEEEKDPTGIWETLRNLIEKQVKKDGIKEESILPYETKDEVLQRAIDTILYDVIEFYGWYFNPDDNRIIWIGEKASQNKDINGKIISFIDEKPENLREAVEATVKDNLEAMRAADEIPAGQDTPSLEGTITDSLTKYIVNWQSWFYDRKMIDDIDNYFEQLDFHNEIYLDEDYGLLSNLIDNSQFDGVSDVPHIAEE